MVESAGGRGRAGPGRPPPAAAAAAVNFPQRTRPASLRTPTPAGRGRSHGFPKRRNEVRFLGPVASGCGGSLLGTRRPRAAGREVRSPA